MILVYFTPIKSEARIFSSFFASAVLILPLIRKHVNLKKLHDKEMQKYLLKLSIPLLPSALSSTLIAQLDKLMIERYESTSALGKYSIAYSVGFMLTTLTTALYSALQPWLMRKLNSKNTEAAGKITERIIFLTSLGLLLFLLLTPEIFRIVAAESYREAEIAVYPLAVAGFLQFISNILSANIIHSEKTVAISVAGLVAFVFNLLSNIALIPKYGYPAAAVTTALSYLLLIVIEYFYLKKHSLDEVVSAKALSPLLLILFGVPIYLIKDFFISRAIFAAVIVLLALPGLIEFIKSFLERRNEKTI